MNYKEQMERWLKENPDATIEQAWEAGYLQSTDNWCHGKVAQMDKLCELITEILEKT